MLDAYVFQLGRICNLVQPSRRGERYRSAIARGRALRELLKIPDDALEHLREIRNRVEHIDEDIDAYLKRGPSQVVQVVVDSDEEVSELRIRTTDRPGVESVPFRSLAAATGRFTSGSVSVDLKETLGDLAFLAFRVLAWMGDREDDGAREFRVLVDQIDGFRIGYEEQIAKPLSDCGYVHVS